MLFNSLQLPHSPPPLFCPTGWNLTTITSRQCNVEDNFQLFACLLHKATTQTFGLPLHAKFLLLVKHTKTFRYFYILSIQVLFLFQSSNYSSKPSQTFHLGFILSIYNLEFKSIRIHIMHTYYYKNTDGLALY